ncbi:MAG: hypothetical protein FJY37_16340, partial [Betaproteobacteria bacterium]|nr:hypothetical protein [Betaproteobacteria bacterium]
MTVTDWRDDGDTEEATEYERANQAQWMSLARLLRWDYNASAGIGAALSQADRVTIDGPTRDLEDERVAAAVLEYNGTHQNIYSEGPSQGLRARLLYETYKPFKTRSTSYEGEIYRVDLNGYLPLGKTVLAMRGIEAR